MFDYFDDFSGLDDYFDSGGSYEYFDDGSYNVYDPDGSVVTYDSNGDLYEDDPYAGGDLHPGDQDDQDAGGIWHPGDQDDQDMAPGSPGSTDPGGTPPAGGGGGTPPAGGGGTGSPSGLGGVLGAIKDYITSVNPGVAAGTGALLGSLLGSDAFGGGSAPRREHLNMADVGKIAPRQTTFGLGPARQVSYDQYGSQQPAPQYDENLLQNLSAPQAPVALADGGAAYYTFGRAINPMDNLNVAPQVGGQKMRSGGLPVLSDVPMTGGRLDFRQGAAVHGPGDGQSDDIPAMLADGEYVIDSETVAQIGNGSTKAGAKALDDFRMNIRKHKRSAPLNKIPPKTKELTSYLKKGD